MRLLIIIQLLIFFIPGNAQTNLSNSFYFPPKNFLQEKNYYYRNQSDTSEKTVWKIKTIVSEGDTLLQTTIFSNGNVAEEMVEKIENGNANILTYSLFNNSKTASCNITDSAVYKLTQHKGERIKWAVSFKDFSTPNIMTISKTRQLESVDGNRQTFLDQMSINMIGMSDAYEYSVVSVYKTGVGLISYKITRPNGQIKDFVLIQIK